ncbi:MAG: hypothetical protein FWC22_07850 [Treponema sp.]|nr:hypothetical protein [Treponema sp.]
MNSAEKPHKAAFCSEGSRAQGIIKNIFSFRAHYSPLWCVLFVVVLSGLNAQPEDDYHFLKDDFKVAQRYVQWIQKAVDDKNWYEAHIALVHASDFDSVSSDISFLHAVYLLNQTGRSNNPAAVIYYLDKALDTNRWEAYSRNDALFFKTEQLIIMRSYQNALDCLEQIRNTTEQKNADIVYLRLLAFRGMASGFVQGYNNAQSLAQFRSLVLNAMDRFPRDSRPLRVFLEYARNINLRSSSVAESDRNLLELVLRRLPFLLETDPELAWMAAPFIRDTGEARRLVASYRSGGIPHIQNRDFKPHPGSIPAALNLGLLGDIEAAEELFSGSRSFNNPLLPYFTPDGNPVIDKDIVTDVYNLLRSEEGREFFTQKLFSFTGIIYSDEDNDGYFDSYARYESGVIQMFEYDAQQKYVSDFLVFMEDGVPSYAVIRVTGQNVNVRINWERYPFVEQVILGNPLSKPNEIIKFGPAVYQYAPVSFITIGGTNKFQGILFPVPDYQYADFTYRTLISFCSSVTRSSMEFAGEEETFFLNRGVIQQAVEVINGRHVSITEFERGLPVLQKIDLDLDGRMETTRHFRSPPQNMERHELLNYRNLMESQESDWHGDGRYKTKEVYQLDGSVVYYFDMDGSGQWTQSETGNQR